jgi:hypothetical protein
MRHPTDPAAVQQGTFTVDITFGGLSEVRCDVCTWLISGGGIDITIDAGSAHCVSGASTMDSIATATLFGVIAQSAVAQAISFGYLTCQATCVSSGISTHVYMAACVTRAGSGLNTAFSPCDQTSICSRAFRICCPNGLGSPTINLISTDSQNCTAGGCQSTSM